MSRAARAAARRLIRDGFARTQPIRRPAQNVLLIEPIVITVSPASSRAATERCGLAVEVQADDRLVHDQRRPRRARQSDQPLAVLGRHRQAGRVLVVGDQVRQPRIRLAERRREHLEVPAVVEHRHRDGPGARSAHGVERRGVGRVLDDAHDPRDRTARAGAASTRAARRRSRRSGRPWWARRAATDTRRSPRAAPAARRRRSPGPGRCRGSSAVALASAACRSPSGAALAAQLRSITPPPVPPGDGAGASAGIGGQPRPRTRAPPARQVALLAQRGVRGGRRRAAHPERLRQLALAGQPRAQRQPAVQHQQPHRAGERRVGGTAGAPLPQQSGEMRSGQATVTGHAGHFITIGYGIQCHFARSCRP